MGLGFSMGGGSAAERPCPPYLFFFLGERLVATAFPNATWTGRGYRSSYDIREFNGGGLTPQKAGLVPPDLRRHH